MGEISKVVGQWIVGNVGWSIIIALFILSGLFKITKIEVNPIGWILTKIGKYFNKGILDHINSLKADTNKQISGLKKDLDDFETSTNASINELKKGTSKNCETLKERLEAMEHSNDMQTIRQIKAHVLDFANSCMNGRKHTRKDFVNIYKENKEYERLVLKYGIENDAYTGDYDFIRKKYKECRETNGFLNDPNEFSDVYEDDEEEWN